jgi:hypothetical protein
MNGMPYEHHVHTVLDVSEGHRIACLVDLGFGIQGRFEFQLEGLDTEDAADYTRGWLDGRELLVRTSGITVSGRWFAEFVDAHNDEHLTVALIDAGYAS